MATPATPPAARPKIGIATLFTREIASLQARTRASKIRYCERWGYTFLEHEGLLCPRPPSWSKLLWVGQRLAEFDWIWWIDADAEIRNGSLPLEPLLDDRHDFIVTKENLPNYEGINGVNLGSFFIRNTPWSHELLRLIFSQTGFIHHFCWEQAAFDQLYREREEVRRHVRIDFDEHRYNSLASSYRKGDMVFHAIAPFRTGSYKLDLIEKIAAEDEQIDFAVEPDIVPLIVLREETRENMMRFTVGSLCSDPHAASQSPVIFLNQHDAGFSATSDWSAMHRQWFALVRTALHQRPGELLLLVHQPVLFLQLWQRSLLLCLRAAHIGFSTTGQHYDSRLLLFRNSPRVLDFWTTLATRFEELPYDKRSAENAIETFFQTAIPPALAASQLRHSALESPAVRTCGPGRLSLEATHVRLQISDAASSPEEVASSFQQLQKLHQQFSQALLRKCYQAERAPEVASPASTSASEATLEKT